MLASLMALLLPSRVNLIGVVATLRSLVAVPVLTWQVATTGAVDLALGGWTPGLGIALRADGLSVALLLMARCSGAGNQYIRQQPTFESAQSNARVSGHCG